MEFVEIRRPSPLGIVLILTALSCTPAASSRHVQDTAPAAELDTFEPAEVRAFLGPAGIEVFYIRDGEVIVIQVPYRKAAAESAAAKQTFTIGEGGIAARLFTGPEAHVLVPPAGSANPDRDQLEQEVAIEGTVITSGVMRREDYGHRGGESFVIEIPALRFPSTGPFRIDSFTQQAWAYPP